MFPGCLAEDRRIEITNLNLSVIVYENLSDDVERDMFNVRIRIECLLSSNRLICSINYFNSECNLVCLSKQQVRSCEKNKYPSYLCHEMIFFNLSFLF